MKRESKFQKELINDIKKLFPQAIVVKNDSSYIQGIPDLSVNLGLYAFHLEVKRSKDSPHRPNQDYYVDHYNNNGGFARFIYPENKEEVLNEMASISRTRG